MIDVHAVLLTKKKVGGKNTFLHHFRRVVTANTGVGTITTIPLLKPPLRDRKKKRRKFGFFIAIATCENLFCII